MRRLLTLVPIAALLTACEDAGNPGNDNLLTGGSLVLIVIIVVVVILMRRRGYTRSSVAGREQSVASDLGADVVEERALDCELAGRVGAAEDPDLAHVASWRDQEPGAVVRPPLEVPVAGEVFVAGSGEDAGRSEAAGVLLASFDRAAARHRRSPPHARRRATIAPRWSSSTTGPEVRSDLR